MKSLVLLLVALCVSVGHGSIHSIERHVAFRPRSVLTTAETPTEPVKARSSEAINVRGGWDSTMNTALVGSVVMALIEKGTKELFKSNGIKFPSQLGACILLFVTMLAAEAVNPDLANSIFNALTPGAALLAKWLPVFFVPGLAMLPLSPPIGSSVEVLKVLLVVSLGFLYTIFTTTFAVVTLRKWQGTLVTAAPILATKSGNKAAPARPFLDTTMDFLLKGTAITAIASVLATRTGNDLATPLQTIFLGFTTVAAYVWGARLPTSFTKLVHPLVTSCALLILVMQLLGVATDTAFLDVLRTFKVGSLDPMKTGAGDILLYLLGPSVVSFAISMYSRRTLLKSNLLVVVLSMLVSSAGGLFGTAAFVRAISLGGANGSMVRLSVLARNVTTALAMALTDMIGGDIAICASVVVLTGILGATYGKTLLTSMGVVDPVCRGLGIGSSSQGLGVAAISDEPDAFPFAAISMVLTAISATTLVSIPSVKDALISLATGA